MNAIIATPGRFFLSRRVAGLFVVFLLLAAAIPAMAVTDLTVFGPQRYERKQGTPTVYTATFERCEPSDLALLRVWNGDEKKSRVTAAEIFVNGREIFAEHEFKQQVDYLESLIDVEEINELRVVLKSGDFKVPAFLKIDVIGKNCDNTPPVITGSQPAAGALLNTSQPLIAVSCRDEPKGSGIDPASVRLTVDGLNVTALADIAPDSVRYSPATGLPEGEHSVVVTVADRAFNPASLSWTFTIDTIAPVAAFSAPPTGLLTNNPLVDIAGSADEPIQTAAINGMPAIVTGKDFGKDGHSLNEGENILIARVTDLAGNVGQGEVRVVLDTVPPAQPKLTPLGPSTNVAETAIMGEAEAFSVVRIFSQFPAATAATLIGVAQADAAGSFSYPGITLTEGTTLFTATATDAAGNESAPSDAVGVLLDTVPPVITVTAPADQGMSEALAIRISGTLNEAAALTIDGAAVSLDGLAFDHPVVLNPGENTFILLATDPAGNTGAASVTVHADNTPPIVTITAPLDGTLTHTAVITVAGTVNEEGCTASLNSQPLLLSSMNFSTSYTLQEGDNILAVRAIDRAGNVGEAAVRVTLDSQPPQLSLAAPAEGIAGRNLELTLDAADPSGLYLLELRAGGPVIWSRTLDGTASATRTVGYTLSPALPPGTQVGLQARALDLAGNQTNAAAQILVTQAAAGPGTLQGEVYDDRRGLRLPGATWTILGRAGEGETTEEGGYFVELPAEDYLVRIGKPGHTVVDRLVSVRSEQNAAALDARLTPMGTGSVKVPVPLTEPLKVTVPLSDGPAIELTLPADALAEEIDLRLTPVSNQGLFGVLPAGWSPLAALDVRALHAVSGEILNAPPVLAEAALLSIPLPEGVEMPLDAVPLLARYDESALQWIAVATADIDTDRRRASAPLGRMGQYALVLSDPDLVAPPPAIIGQPLDAGESAAPDFDNLTAAGRVVPPASPPLKGLIAVGEVVLTPAVGGALLPSGTVVNARINERFDLTSGESVQPADYVQDLVLYRYPCVTNPQRGVAGEMAGEGSLRTTFPVSPSREYGFVDLLLGKVGVEIQLAEEEAADGMMIGAAGARLLTEAGDALEIPAGALARTTPVALRPASAGAAGAIGDDFVLLRALAVDLTGQTLMAPATLSIAVPAGFDPALPVVLARVVEFGGVQRLKLAGFVQKSGSMLVSETTLSASSAPSAVKELILPGVTVSGTYAFLQAKAPIGLVGGKVTAIAGTPFAGARVSAAGATLADLTGGDGRYLLALPLAPFTLRAVDPHMADRGEGSIHLQSAWQLATLDLAIQAVPPRVVALEPADGATGVVPSAALRIVFSEPVERTSVTEQSVVLKDNAGAVIPGVFSFSPAVAAVAFYPSVPLRSETVHTLTVATAVRDLQGYSLAASATSTFTVRKTVPPPMPPAGAITATFPDAGGMITVTATQGSAPADVTVLVINDTTGEIVAVVPQSNGSFTARINAQLGDEIQVVLMDASGNQTIVTYLTFKAPDGRYLVTAKGGKVEGEGGSLLEIPEGALVGPAVIRLTLVLETELPHAVPELARFLGAVKIDTGGIGFQKSVKLSVPAPADLPADLVPFVAQPTVHQHPDGTEEEVYIIHDSAKIIDGRVTTASPPFAGVMGFGIFGFLYPDPIGPVGGPVVVSGTTYRDMDGLGGYMPGVDQPIRGAVIRSPGAENFISYSDAKGHYASYGFTARDVCRNFAITAIHPHTMFRNTANLTTCDAPYFVDNFNLKLADKETVVPDTVAPAISIGLQVVPGQAGDPRLIAGTILVGTDLSVPISIVDQEVGSATLTVEFKTPDMDTAQVMPMTLHSENRELHTRSQGENPALYREHFRPLFSGTIAGAIAEIFRPDRPGTYVLVVEAVDSAGNRASRRIQVRAVEQGEAPGSVDGAPQVDSILPADGAVDVMVTSHVVAWFSEPVDNVTDTTFRLFEVESGREVPAYVYTALEGGRMLAMLVPKGNLTYGRAYRVTLGNAIKDLNVNPGAPPPYAPPTGDGLLPLAETSITFTTKVPRAFDLVEDAFTGGRDIAIYTRPEDSRTFVYVAAGTSGWRVVEVTDPTRPALVHSVPAPVAGWNYRGVSVEQEVGLLALTDHVTYASGEQFGYVRFHDLTADPAKPPRVGQEKLAEAYSGIPGRLDLAGHYAYIATVMAGVQVVDIERAKTHIASGTPTDGSAIVGVFDSGAQGYGQPSDVKVYAPGRLLVTTTTGCLLLISTANPELPTLNSAWRPEGSGVTRAVAVGGYQFTDSDGSPAAVDLAMAGLRDGRIVTLDITDPYNPRQLGMAVNESGETVITWVNDLSVNKEAGLAFITTMSSIQVFDIKDPAFPRLLIAITELPDENGNLIPLGSIPALVEQGGWVFLGSESRGMRVVDLDPHTLRIVPKPITLAGKISALAKEDVLLGVEIRPDTAFRARSAYLRVYENDQLLWETPQSVPMEVQTSVIFPAKNKGFTFDVRKRYTAGIRLINMDGAVFEMEKKDRVSLPLSWPVIFPDYNHDRKIDQADIDRAVKGDTYYFWINDDDDEGEEGADGNIPGKTRTLSFKLDFENEKVDGVRDLVDFFPVVLDIKHLLQVFDPADFFYVLESEDENLKLVLTDLSRATVGKYLVDVPTARKLGEAETCRITAAGLLLNPPLVNVNPYGRPLSDIGFRKKFWDFLLAVKNQDDEVVLLEGMKKGNKPLVLEVRNDQGGRVFVSQLNLSLDGVEQMFRHVNLVPTIGNTKAPAEETGKIGENSAKGGEANRFGSDDFDNKEHFSGFDAELNEHYFVQLHGANVNGQDARAWHSEMFKRLYWSGSKAKFVGVTWYSDEGLTSANYQPNVVNAFRTAEQFGQNVVKATQNAPVAIMAHSLGNMVVSSYLNDFYQKHPLDVTDYFLFNAAVALEAYLGDYQGYAEGKLNDPDTSKTFGSDNPMVHSDWFDYDKRLGSSEWYQLFGPNDPRRMLTWRNRFANLPDGINYHSFYSTGEDILATHIGETPNIQFPDLWNSDLARYSWVLQEKWKGRNFPVGSTDLMGWDFNLNHYWYMEATSGGGLERRIWHPVDANRQVRNEQLLTEPFFRKPSPGQPGSQLFGPTIDAEYVSGVRDELLALALPSLTLVTGGWMGEAMEEYKAVSTDHAIDMNDLSKKNGWPDGRENDDWRHSDIKDIAYVFGKNIFDSIVNRGGSE